MNKEIYEDILNIISQESKVFEKEPMSKHTSFKIGGPADIYIIAKSLEDIKKILEYVNKNKIELTIVGNGTNLLVKDNGIRGITLKPELDNLKINENTGIATVGSGITLTFLAQKLLKKELTGFEFASGIPGTIGGAIKMNAGAHGREMKDVVISTKYITLDGEIKEIDNQLHKFEYRRSVFEDEKGIILETKLKLEKGNFDEIKNIMTEYANYRKSSQPLEFPSAGSTFKRGNGFITAKLIDECGLKGYNVGGAEVSEKHAGFIKNKGKATAEEVLKLIEIIKQKVKEKFGYDIQLEIKIIGE